MQHNSVKLINLIKDLTYIFLTRDKPGTILEKVTNLNFHHFHFRIVPNHLC